MDLGNPVIFDLETDGHDRIIQIAALAPLSGNTFEVKVRFNEAKANHACLYQNHYDHEVWEREAVNQKKARDLFNAFLYDHASVPNFGRWHDRLAIGMGYNTNHFDMPILQHWYGEGCERLCMDPRTYDVLELARWTLPSMRSYTLSSVAGFFGVLRDGAHDARVDCEMTADVAAGLLIRLYLSPPRWVLARNGDNRF